MRIGYFVAWQIQTEKVPQGIVYSYQFASCVSNCVMIFEPKCFHMGCINNAWIAFMALIHNCLLSMIDSVLLRPGKTLG